MNASDKIRFFKALSDKSRLKIINCLMDKPHYVEELSERLGLAASTVSFHLKKLEEAELVESRKEQYYVTYTLRRGVLERPLKELITVSDVEKQDQRERLDRYRAKVLDTFFRYGKLVKIPVQRKKRRIVLEEILGRFEEGRRYEEKEVNLIIAEFHDDFCTIRREMIEFKLMAREGGLYWRV